jgi:hypothetical protein
MTLRSQEAVARVRPSELKPIAEIGRVWAKNVDDC